MVQAMAAPHFEDDRSELVDVTGVPEKELPLQRGRVVAGGGGAAGEAAPAQLLMVYHVAPELADSSRFSPGGSGAFSSTENPTNGLDGNFSACFRNVDRKTDSTVPVITDNTLLEEDDIWSALTNNHDHVAPVGWKPSQTHSLYTSTFNLREELRETNAVVELWDEEELRQQLDMHSIIAPCIEEEPLVTAEQVIEEIEEMMQDSPDKDVEHNPSQSDLSMLSLDIQLSSPAFQKMLRALNVTELLERLKDMEMNIRRFSEELVQQLAIRDELGFEKEVKNSFISALIDVQNRQKEHKESAKKKKKIKSETGTGPGKTPVSHFSVEGISSIIHNSFRQTFGSGCSDRQYLTTVIPYEKKGHPPSIEDLQILTKILQAMRDDSDKVPSLLTDYILNVFCPT